MLVNMLLALPIFVKTDEMDVRVEYEENVVKLSWGQNHQTIMVVLKVMKISKLNPNIII